MSSARAKGPRLWVNSLCLGGFLGGGEHRSGVASNAGLVVYRVAAIMARFNSCMNCVIVARPAACMAIMIIA